VPITRMSSEALRILDEHPCMSIHSVFGSAVNLRAGHRLVNCSSEVISIPYGIEMTLADLGQLQRLHRTAPHDLLQWRPLDRAISGHSGKVEIASTPHTAVFGTALAAASGNSLDVAVSELVAHLARTRARTGLGEEWPALIEDRNLTGAVESLADGRADRPVIHWLGRGPGLTPSGDDILVGMVAALRFMGAVDSSGLAPLRQLIQWTAGRLTTDISVEYLHYACRGMVTAMVRDLLVALDRSDTVAALDAVDRLRRYGHTSGMDCVLGVVTALLHVSRDRPSKHHTP
jgi:hypothetical protein